MEEKEEGVNKITEMKRKKNSNDKKQSQRVNRGTQGVTRGSRIEKRRKN